jgi:hypothetical protein
MTGADLPAGQPVILDEVLAETLFADDLSDEQWTEYLKGFVPEAVGIMNARLSGYPDGVPMTYINMTDDVPVPPTVADQMVANLCARVERRALCGGHSVMLSKPGELAAIINEVVARASGNASTTDIVPTDGVGWGPAHAPSRPSVVSRRVMTLLAIKCLSLY